MATTINFHSISCCSHYYYYNFCIPQHYPTASPFLKRNPNNLTHQNQNQNLLKKTFPISYSTPTPDSSTTTIFLPFLQTPARKQTQIPPEFDEKIHDPILKFFKTRTSDPDPDPTQEGRISLLKNRKTSWHLATNFEQSDVETDINDYYYYDTPSPTLSKVEERGIVEEILEMARALPENVTIGEGLENRRDFGGRLGEAECVEVLRALAEDADDVMSCLYFFEWMGLREPNCLVTPRACSVLFTALGKAGKGKELLLVFKNLPFEQSNQFKDVRVYNAAMSGLLSCGRISFTSFVATVLGVNWSLEFVGLLTLGKTCW